MGAALPTQAQAPQLNDYELVCRTAKELEWLLERHFGAAGRGLGEKIAAAEAAGALSPVLCRRLRFVAAIRNRLVHERGFDAIPNRPRFLEDFEAARLELESLVAYREAVRRRDEAVAWHAQKEAVRQRRLGGAQEAGAPWPEASGNQADDAQAEASAWSAYGCDGRSGRAGICAVM